MPVTKTEFPGLLIIQPKIWSDDRGYFFESYNEKELTKEGVNIKFVQDNQARSTYGVIRGLHYQLNPHPQTKLIRALSGSILDVTVDIRKGSPTYGKVFYIELSAENKTQLLVPQGFAHGYSVLTDSAEVFYKCDEFYYKEYEAGVSFNDPALNINWQIEKGKELISEKDTKQPLLEFCVNNFNFGA